MRKKFKEFYFRNRFFLTFLLCWIILFSGVRTLQHLSFGTNACDLSLFDYGMHYTLKGELMSDPFHKFVYGGWESRDGELVYKPLHTRTWESHFVVHFTPIIFFYLPFYLVFDGPLFLLYLQVLFVGLSALPLYLIAKSVFKDNTIPFIIALIYLFFRHLLIGLMHDIHFEMLFPLLFLSIYYFIAIRKKIWLYFVLITLAFFLKEDIAIYIFFFGLFLIFKMKQKKYGLITSLYSLFYLGLALGIIIPYFRNQAGLREPYVYYHVWGQTGENLIQVIWNILKQPGLIFKGIPLGLVLEKFSNIISPLFLVPFFSSYALLVFPPLLVTILSKTPQIYTFGIHYSATLLPFIFLSFIYGLKNLQNFFEKQKPVLLKRAFVLIALLLILTNMMNSNFWRIANPSRYENIRDYQKVKQIIHQIPPDASVAALSALVPHIPKRKKIFMLPDLDDAEYILVHSKINLWPYKKEEFQNFLRRIEHEKKYKCIDQSGEIRLYKKVVVPDL